MNCSEAIKMINSIESFIDESTTIAILCHINPDGDALCSSYALADVLRNMGKSVVCVFEDEPGAKYDFLGGEYEVFDNERDYTFDLVIAVDCADAKRLGKLYDIFKKAPRTINIDHHKTNDNFAMLNVVKPHYCAAAEVIAELLFDMEADISDCAARLLYGGIMSDSGCLKFSSTTPATHRTVAKLLEHDFDHSEVTRMLFDSNTMELTRLTGYVMNNIESYSDGKITMICTTSELLEQYGVDEKEANNLINIPRSVKGAEIAVEVKQRSGQIRVSIRSNGEAEVDRVAAVFGGGGHIRAAGATIENMTFEDAKNAVIEACMNELKRCIE